jgi:hypothetical protein
MSQQIPDKPAWLTDGEWNYILERDKHQCALFETCKARGLLGQTNYCSHKLDTDHWQPQVLGGDDSWSNLRLLCEAPNRGRPIEAAPHWAEANIWDDPIALAQLRETQRIAGYDAVTNPAVVPCPTKHRNALLRRVTLVPGVTGVGKAVMMESILFGINHSIGVGFPRARKILWLTPDQTLRDLAVIELASDIYDHKIIVRRAPSVIALDSYNDFQKGPGDHDICVSCPHVLFDVTDTSKNNGKRRSDDEIRHALKWFDVIVFDEGDWAKEQVRHIATLASHALKFALTASLPNLDTMEQKEREKFLRTFVLISEDAIADYQSAFDLDSCVKYIDPALSVIVGASHDEYEAFVSGQRATFSGVASPDHVPFLAIIEQAIHDADRLETQMRADSPDHYFSPHLIARFDRIEDVIAAHTVLNQILPNRALQNDGWLTTPIFQGHMRRLPHLSADEADLSARKHGKWRHPFFRAKNTGGVADNKCKRVLLMCNIGLRGINNWPILFTVDCVEEPTWIEEIQFDFGRPIRWPDKFAHFLTDKELRQFATMRIYFPKVGGWEAKKQSLDEVREFITNMKTRIAGYGFHTWIDIIEGRPPDDMPAPNVAPQAPAFTMVDKLTLQNTMGEALAIGVQLNNDGEIETILDKLDPEATGERRERAKSYVENLRDRPEFRATELLATDIEREAQINPETVLTRLKPQSSYDTHTLEQYIHQDARFAANRQQLLDDLQNSVSVRNLISQILHDTQIVNYREAPRVWRLQGPAKPPEDRGVLRIVAGELSHMLITAGALNPKDAGTVQIFMNDVAVKFFGVSGAEEGGDMDHHAYHVAILGRCRRKLQSLTRAQLTRKNILVNMARLASMK